MVQNKMQVLLCAFLVACVVALLGVTSAQASPAAPIEFTLTQPDGLTFQAHQWGDEWNHGTETLDGYAILKDPGTGWWVYAAIQPDGSLAPGLGNGKLQVVGKVDPRAIPKHLRPTQLTENPRSGAFSAAGINAPVGKFTGTQPTLVILVEFTDKAHTTLPIDWYNVFFNTETVPNSVSNYYYEVSYGKMVVVPAAETNTAFGGWVNDGVVGWVNVGYQHPNPGKGDTRPLAADAIYATNPYIDYSLYDDNDNGIISTDELHIFIIAAGYEAAYSGSGTPAVWGNNWWIDGSYVGCPSLDGVLLGCIGEGSYYAYGGGYSIIGEMMGGHMSTMGIMAHELGHDIYWPDLYNTAMFPITVGVGWWSLMAEGSWRTYGGEMGNWPTHPSAWEKYYQGWLTPIAIEKEEYWIYAPPVETNPAIYLLRHNTGGVDYSFLHHSGLGEYFLAEYRQQIGFDLSAPGCGILIWHINETAPFDYNANNSFQPLVRLEQADGVDWGDKGNAGDVYIGIPPRDIFNDSSSPNSRLYNGTSTGVAAYIQSTSCGSTISMELVGSHTTKLPLILKNYPPPWTTITGEMFEGGDFPKIGWNIGSTNYRVGARPSPCKIYDGLYSGWMVGRGPLGNSLTCGANYPDGLENGDEVTLTYGPFSTVGATAAQLTYHYWTNLDAWNDYLWVGVSANNSTYTEIYYTGNSAGWQFEAFDLNDPLRDGSISYLNLPAVWVRFMLRTDRWDSLPEGVYLDNILLRKCTASICIGAPPSPEFAPLNSPAIQDFLKPFLQQFSSLRLGKLP